MRSSAMSRRVMQNLSGNKIISSLISRLFSSFFFFNDTATTEIYTLSLHDALPICGRRPLLAARRQVDRRHLHGPVPGRSEEHTSELQSRLHLVCRLLLEKKNRLCAATSSRLLLLAQLALAIPRV